MPASSVAERLAEIRDRIGEASTRAGRDPGEVTLVGASKRQPMDRLRAAAEAGLRVFGENRIQEAEQKIPVLPVDLDWHFIGTLQSNKTKIAARLFSTIHSVDRLKIARRLDREAGELDRRLRVFLQVNVGDQTSKQGFPEDGLAAAVRPIAELEHLEVLGLMAIPAYEENLENARKWLRRLRELRDDLAERPEWAGFPGQLSMGMSHDFEIAVEEGATHVRIGSLLFGPREA